MSSQVEKWNFISSGKFLRKSIRINGNELQTFSTKKITKPLYTFSPYWFSCNMISNKSINRPS
jgi:hypothetical protein